MMKIAIIGVGYVGLVSGLCFAKKHEVIFVDVDANKINLLNKGRIPFYEPNLNELRRQVSKRAKFTTDLSKAADADFIFVCTGTPTKGNDIDLSHIKNACKSVGKMIRGRNTYPIIVIKSTVVPKTTSSVLLPILEKHSKKKAGNGFGLCVNPEFLREGNAVEDFLEPDRIIIGALNEKDSKLLSDFYKKFFNDVHIAANNLNTAEMIKYCSNAFFPLLISFSNEFAEICERIPDVDVHAVLDAVSMDKRINQKVNGRFLHPGIVSYLKAGCGFGGSCFPKDLKALTSFIKKMNYKPELLQSILSINDSRVQGILNRIEKRLGNLKDKKICILGLSFKPNTDDIRESPSIYMIERLLEKSAKVFAHDPVAIKNAQMHFKDRKGVVFSEDISKALEASSCCIVMTSWEAYKKLDPQIFKEKMNAPLLVDCRRIYDKDIMKDYVDYVGIGLMSSGKPLK